MASYITLSEINQWLELATYVEELKNKGKAEADQTFLEDCQKLLTADSKAELLSKLLSEYQLIFAQSKPKELAEIEGFFLVISSLVKELPPANLDAGIERILKALTSDPKDKPLFRLKLLSNFHNIITEPARRYTVFSSMLHFALTSKLVRTLENYFSTLHVRLQEYQLKPDQIQVVYKLIRDYYRDNGPKNIELEWTLKYLALFGTSTADSENEAIRAIVDSVKAPGVFQFDELLTYVPIKELEKGSEKAKKAFALLKIFVEDTWVAFQDFQSKNADFMKTYEINVEEASRKLRLLTLCNAAVSKQTLTYSTIADALKVDEDQVEMWVIDAIGENILDAKLDQQKRVAIITRSLHRVFTKDNWKQLGEHLTVWKNNITGLQSVLADCAQKQNAIFALAHQQ